MIGQNLSLQQSGAPVSSAWATRQEASETGEAQWFQQRSNVNIDMYLYLFQPSFHPDRPDQPVCCLESGAALPILVLYVINNRQKVSINYPPLNAKKWKTLHLNVMETFCTHQQENCILSICRWGCDDVTGCQNQDSGRHPDLYCTHHHRKANRRAKWSLTLDKNREEDGNGKERVEKCGGSVNSIIDSSTLGRSTSTGTDAASLQLIIERWSYANLTILAQYNLQCLILALLVVNLNII